MLPVEVPFIEEVHSVATAGGAAFSKVREAGVFGGQRGQEQGGAQEGERAGRVGVAQAATRIFAPAGIAAPVVAVFDAPVSTDEVAEALGAGLLGGEAGNEEALELGGLLGLLDSAGGVDRDGLADGGHAGLFRFAGGRGHGPHFNTAVAAIGQGKKGVPSGTAKRATSSTAGWLPLTCSTYSAPRA